MVKKQAGIASLIAGIIDFKWKLIRTDKEGQFLPVEGSINEENITILNMCAPNSGAPNFIKSIIAKLKTWIKTNPVTIGDINTPIHQQMDHLDREKERSERKIPEWNDI